MNSRRCSLGSVAWCRGVSRPVATDVGIDVCIPFAELPKNIYTYL